MIFRGWVEAWSLSTYSQKPVTKRNYTVRRRIVARNDDDDDAFHQPRSASDTPSRNCAKQRNTRVARSNHRSEEAMLPQLMDCLRARHEARVRSTHGTPHRTLRTFEKRAGPSTQAWRGVRGRMVWRPQLRRAASPCLSRHAQPDASGSPPSRAWGRERRMHTARMAPSAAREDLQKSACRLRRSRAASNAARPHAATLWRCPSTIAHVTASLPSALRTRRSMSSPPSMASIAGCETSAYSCDVLLPRLVLCRRRLRRLQLRRRRRRRRRSHR